MDEPIPVVDALDRGESDQQVSADASSLDEQGAEGKEVDKVPSIPKEDGLITLSGLPPAHWKNLFHLELVKERNKPKEPPKKPPSAPFFLQWRGGEPLAEPPKEENEKKADGQEEEEWAAAWSDDDEGREEMIDGSEPETDRLNSKRERSEGHDKTPNKRQKIKQYRSHLASLLERCSKTRSSSGQRRFQAVTDYIASLGPSAIDVELSALCSGMHDLEEGLPQLLFACQWLLEACQSRERFEAVNAYLHRFLYLHASVIIGVKEKFRGSDPDQEAKISPEEINEEQRLRRDRLLLIEFVSQLKRAQKDATEALREKMEHTLCLLRHFSRMI
jgi:U3 small nucleolar RNA-associated protein 21